LKPDCLGTVALVGFDYMASGNHRYAYQLQNTKTFEARLFVFELSVANFTVSRLLGSQSPQQIKKKFAYPQRIARQEQKEQQESFFFRTSSLRQAIGF
jgi:hypothetical protein